MLPPDWLEYVASVERDIASRPETAPKRPQGVKKMVSPRQRQALSSTRNQIKAIYQPVNGYNQAITIDADNAEFTTNLGGNCEPDRPHGKATTSRS